MKCGLCGSGICADKKYKKLKNGTINSYIYYGYSKVQDKTCECGYITEFDLVKQLECLVNQVSVSKSGIKNQTKVELTRIKRFQLSVLGIKQEILIADVDIKEYVKFILRDGSIEEKRELLTCFK